MVPDSKLLFPTLVETAHLTKIDSICSCQRGVSSKRPAFIRLCSRYNLLCSNAYIHIYKTLYNMPTEDYSSKIIERFT